MFPKIYNTVIYLWKIFQLHNYYKGHCEEVLWHDNCIELLRYTHRSAEDTVLEGARGSAWTTGASDLLRASKTGDS